MNDRYLYRAKRISSPNAGEWVKGTYVHTNLGREMICDGTTYIGINRPCMIDIDISTLCACTGLKDKNGKLIWENDIVHNGNYFVVKWNLSCARFDFALNNSNNIPVGRWEPMIIDWKNSDFKEYRNNIDFEVIGNIFDNPELLE